VYRSRAFVDRLPDHVRVIESSDPIDVMPGIQIIGAPWPSKRPLEDLVAKAILPLTPLPGVIRVVAGHGAVDTLSPDRTDPATINVSSAELAVEKEIVHYIALGDRHSLTSVGSSGRIHYAGTPEPTDFIEVEPGRILIVDFDGANYSADPVEIGTWAFVDRQFEMSGAPDLDLLESWLTDLPNKDRTVVRLALRGTLNITDKARLDSDLDRFSDLYAAIELWDRQTELVIIPDDADFSDIGLAGFAESALEELRGLALGSGEDSQTAKDSLALLYRLTGGGS